jgi:DNA mismatch endonuclease, patch repair protein
MPDMFTPEKRSQIMSRIKSKGSSSEKEVFRYLRRERIYFQKHYSRAPGQPDVALPRKKKAIFIDGGFWHGWKFEERKAKLPREYWVEKISKNIQRDRKNRSELRAAGWSVLRIWDHDLRGKKKVQTLAKIARFLAD